MERKIKKTQKVISINKGLQFEDGYSLYSEHEQECCESHYLDFSNLSIDDFEGLEFDLSNDNFFERIPDFGIALLPVNGHPIRIPGYASNNGYYSQNLTLVLEYERAKRMYAISDCQFDCGD